LGLLTVRRVSEYFVPEVLARDELSFAQISEQADKDAIGLDGTSSLLAALNTESGSMNSTAIDETVFKNAQNVPTHQPPAFTLFGAGAAPPMLTNSGLRCAVTCQVNISTHTSSRRPCVSSGFLTLVNRPVPASLPQDAGTR